jgi:hypothetical protein
MLYTQLSIILLTIIFFLLILAVISYFNINMNYDNNYKKLNRKVTYSYN